MRAFGIFLKTMREQTRDLASLSMVLVLCPFFVALYWVISGGGSTSYKILVLNRDRGVEVGERGLVNEGERVVSALRAMRYSSGDPMVREESVSDSATATEQLRNRYAAALLILPEDFSKALHAGPGFGSGRPTALTIVGDPSNPTYTIASVFALTAADSVIRGAANYKPPVDWTEEFLTASKPRTEFESYVPGLLILSVIMLVFTTALPLVREREEKTLRRLRVSSMRPFDLLAGISLAQLVIGAAAIVLTFFTAAALGFRSEGRLWEAVVLGFLTAGSVIAVGLLTACFCRSATAVLTIGTLPFFLLMWFSGAAMPMPRVTLFVLGTRQIALNDLLPPTHAVIAMNKILSFGASLPELGYEIGALLVLTAVYFFAAVAIYRRTQMRKI